jgi:hypothetical protein
MKKPWRAALLSFPKRRRRQIESTPAGGRSRCKAAATISRVGSKDESPSGDRPALFRLLRFSSRMFGTKVGGKLFVALGLVLLLQFIERLADERTGSAKHPRTPGATEPLKVRILDPDQLARHGQSISPMVCKIEQCLEARRNQKSGRAGGYQTGRAARRSGKAEFCKTPMSESL